MIDDIKFLPDQLVDRPYQLPHWTASAGRSMRPVSQSAVAQRSPQLLPLCDPQIRLSSSRFPFSKTARALGFDGLCPPVRHQVQAIPGVRSAHARLPGDFSPGQSTRPKHVTHVAGSSVRLSDAFPRCCPVSNKRAFMSDCPL